MEIVLCAPSIHDENTWFIFRENGVEIKIERIGDNLKADRKLTDLEIEYLNNNLR